MAAKRKDKRPAKPREDLSAPSKWRAQHGDIGPATRVADPESGAPITLDTGIARRKALTLPARQACGVHHVR